MTHIEKYKEYWNCWHKTWYDSLKTPENNDKICGWEIPKKNLGNEASANLYFPEPYWGNIDSKELHALFLNINPGQGNQDQLCCDVDSDLFKEYKKNNDSYSETVKELSKKSEYPTTKWMIKNRINWLNNLLDSSNSSLSDTLISDLIPWHSRAKQNIIQYTNENSEFIINQVITPITEIANKIEGSLKNIVIVRSSLFLDILKMNTKLSNKVKRPVQDFVILDSNNEYKKLNSLLSLIEIDNTKFLVFSGGANMQLPNLDYYVFPIGKNSKEIKLKEFILNLKQLTN